mmetsp:Transcript_15984/g.41093  ORF Transcript_15984/g.41093 Transcript_15984/m.41093 type:complete len:347 (-) Transcript_15984:12-1052(-)
MALPSLSPSPPSGTPSAYRATNPPQNASPAPVASRTPLSPSPDAIGRAQDAAPPWEEETAAAPSLPAVTTTTRGQLPARDSAAARLSASAAGLLLSCSLEKTSGARCCRGRAAEGFGAGGARRARMSRAPSGEVLRRCAARMHSSISASESPRDSGRPGATATAHGTSKSSAVSFFRAWPAASTAATATRRSCEISVATTSAAAMASTQAGVRSMSGAQIVAVAPRCMTMERSPVAPQRSTCDTAVCASPRTSVAAVETPSRRIASRRNSPGLSAPCIASSVAVAGARRVVVVVVVPGPAAAGTRDAILAQARKLRATPPGRDSGDAGGCEKKVLEPGCGRVWRVK